jgi:hypothetical protein
MMLTKPALCDIKINYKYFLDCKETNYIFAVPIKTRISPILIGITLIFESVQSKNKLVKSQKIVRDGAVGSSSGS